MLISTPAVARGRTYPTPNRPSGQRVGMGLAQPRPGPATLLLADARDVLPNLSNKQSKTTINKAKLKALKQRQKQKPYGFALGC